MGAGILLSAMFIASPLTVLWAQEMGANKNGSSNPQFSYMNQFSNPIPKINGSINVAENLKNVFKENTKVSFAAASETAQKQILNGTILGGHLGVIQGYLVYSFMGINPETHTAYHTLIDAGNGKVLYTSPSTQLGVLREGFGHGPFGFGFPPWRATGGFMNEDGILH